MSDVSMWMAACVAGVTASGAGVVGIWYGRRTMRKAAASAWQAGWLTARQQAAAARALTSAAATRTLLGEYATAQLPAVRVAGSDLPPRGVEEAATTADAETIVAGVLDLSGAYDVYPDDEPSEVSVGTSSGDSDRDVDGGPGGGLTFNGEPAPQYRYHWGAPLPETGPWRPAVNWVRREATLLVRHATGRWTPADRWQQWCDRLRLRLLAVVVAGRGALDAYLARYRHQPAHAHRVLQTRSWFEVAEERSRQWAQERRQRGLELRWLAAERTGARWALMLPELRAALRPVQHSPALMPNVGCTP